MQEKAIEKLEYLLATLDYSGQVNTFLISDIANDVGKKLKLYGTGYTRR